MVKNLKKILSILCVFVMTAAVFSAVVTNVLADKNGDEDEKIILSLNPDVATNEYIHVVWQENLTGQMEIYYVNDACKNFEDVLESTISRVETLIVKDDVYEDILEELNEALEEYTERDYKHSIDKVHHAVKDLEKAGNTELITMLIDSVKDFAKTNILYAEDHLTFNNSYIQEAYDKYYLAVDKYEEKNYDAAVKQFKNSYLKIVEAYEENDETYIGVDFGKIVRISYTDYDSVNPQIFLNGTISVGWKEIMDNVSHVYYARSSNNGISWWYFDANEYASTYLCYAGIDPSLVNIENMLTITRTLERIWIIDRCHYFYAPIIRDGFTIEDRRVYAPINDPYLIIYDGMYEPILIGDKKFYIICGPGPMPVPPPKAPDLTVENISVSHSFPVEGCEITYHLKIKNIGDASISGSNTVTFLEDSFRISNATLGPVPMGEHVSVDISWIPSKAKNDTHFEIQIDPDNYLQEGNEGNNNILGTIKVFTQTGDEDGDNLNNYDEVYRYGTDPTSVDTDNDGLWDGYITTSKNITYVGELSIRADPKKWDTDGDSIGDGEEVLQWLTDPTLLDSDGDGLTDYEEISITGTCPTNPDTNNNGISDKDDPDPITIINYGVYATACKDENVDFNGSHIVTDAYRYYWDFNNDGDFDYLGRNAWYKWGNTGEYTVMLTVLSEKHIPTKYTLTVVVVEGACVSTGSENYKVVRTSTFSEENKNVGTFGIQLYKERPRPNTAPGDEIAPYCGSLSGTGSSYNFSVSSLSGTYTVVMVGNEVADFDLYAKWNSAPTTSSYDARGYSTYSLEYFPIAGSGTLYVMVHSYSGSGYWKCNVIFGGYSIGLMKTGTLSGTGETATFSLAGNGRAWVYLAGPGSYNPDFDLYIKWNSAPTTSNYDDEGYTVYSQEICDAEGYGTLYFMVRSYSGSGEYSMIALIFSSLAYPVDNTVLTWSTGGNANWVYDTSIYYYSGDSARSGTISHNQNTYIQGTITGPGTLSFYWKVSSEYEYDWLIFYIDGAEQDRISGYVDWYPKNYFIPAGSHTLQWKYTKDGSVSTGSDRGWIDKVVWTGTTTIPIGDAVDNTALSWTTGGNANWFGYTNIYYYGGDSARNGYISDSQNSYIQTTVTGPGTLTFYWKVCSETNYDYLRFYIDGTQQAKISGLVDWEYRSYSISSGSHTLQWKYTKDGSVYGGSDCGWLDKVVFLANYPPNTPSTPSGSTSGITGTSYTYSTSTTDPDGDNIKYTFSWGDGTTTTSSFYSSGNTASASKSWGAAGTYYVKVKAIDTNGLESGWSGSLTVTIVPSLGEAVDNTALSWTTSGNANWFGQTSTYYYGDDAAQSGAITHNQNSYIQTTVTGPGTLKFYWKVSSESNYDYLRFYIDGAEQTKISGSVSWQQKSYSISSGSHTLQWKYTKDGSVNTGSDCGWIDKVEFSVEYEVTVKISKILQLDEVDIGSDGDFYAEVLFYPDGGSSWITHKTSITTGWDVNPNWIISQKVPKATWVWVVIRLWDDDGGLGNDLCDIKGYGSAGHDKQLELFYYFSDRWTGDDARDDSNGIGYASGYEDGSTGTDEDDCSIWFEIYDNTRIEQDSDSDGLPDWWEYRYSGSTTGMTATGTGSDPDNDGLDNSEEYTWNCIPVNHKNILVEVDWMASSGFFDPAHNMVDGAVRRLMKAFAKHNIDLHIDRDGEISHDNNFNWPDDWDTYYNDYFTSSRKGSFHYCVMAHRDGSDSWFTLGQGESPGDMFVLYDANIWYDKDNNQALIFMHELGHNILGDLDDVHEIGDDHCSIPGCVMNPEPDILGRMTMSFCLYCEEELMRDGLLGL